MNDGDGQARSARRFNYIMAAFMVVIAGVITQGTFLTDRAKGDISMPLVFPTVLIALLLTLSVMLVAKTRARSLPEPEGEQIVAGRTREGSGDFRNCSRLSPIDAGDRLSAGYGVGSGCVFPRDGRAALRVHRDLFLAVFGLCLWRFHQGAAGSAASRPV